MTTELGHLLGAYLNLDWPEEYGTWWAAVDDYCVHEPSAKNLVPEIEEVLRTITSEAGLRRLVVDELDSGYLPDADGTTTYREWLEAVAWRVRDRLGQGG